MKTPIVDFVKAYYKSKVSRFHMPGHKGKKILGCEHLDITEIEGADILYSPSGIIEQSEQNATNIFGTEHTYYSTEGATLAIKAMILNAYKMGNSKTIIATRNCHKSFISACALLDLNAEWIYPEEKEHFCSCSLTPQTLEKAIKTANEKPFAVYITSPDYAGNIADISNLAKVCDNEHIPLLVDNAHGAYSAFTNPAFHPIKLGATMCVDSAHKTLPVLTGGAYLHIAKGKSEYLPICRDSLSLFASTSPSYLILQSLDKANLYIEKNSNEFNQIIDKINCLKLELLSYGYPVLSGEPLKIVISAKDMGYYGYQLASMLRKAKIENEMADSQIVVLMLSPQNSTKDLKRLKKALLSIPIKAPIKVDNISIKPTKKVLSIRQATLSKSQILPVSEALGKIAADTYICCPPAIPVVVSGEEIDENTVQILKSINITKVNTVIEKTDF